ncbi:MAG: tRNA isopentenyl-2-thiomethyl-A-37 hydroxylase MiaE [Deferribacterales bacterium]
MSISMQKALKTAHEAEKEGMKNYLKYAKATKYVNGKNMFIQLALDEIDHMELIEQFMEKALKGEKITSVDVPKSRLAKFMPDLKDIKKAEKADVSDSDALKVALIHEEKASKFYLDEAAKAEDPELKAFFQKLADVEQKHYAIIKAELDFMQEDGFWFDAMEFSLEK